MTQAPLQRLRVALGTKRKELAMAKNAFPVIYLARHGETSWSREGRHTGRTDLPLTPQGERNAQRLRERLDGLVFVKSLTSPLQRAKRTCELAGFGEVAEIDPDLVEWNYGDYEGVRTAEVRKKRPGWELFRDGCPNGESPADVAARADRVVARTRAMNGDVLIFSSGHFLRMFAARWLGLEPLFGRYLMLDTGSLSTLTYEHDLCDPAIRVWNATEPTLTTD